MIRYSIRKLLKILFICLRHGINPFGVMDKNKVRMKERFTENEKKWIINNSENKVIGKYYEELFYG